MDSIYSAVYTITYVVLILGIISGISIACRARGPNIAMLNRKDNCSETAEKVPLDQGPCSAADDCKSARKFY